MPTDTFICVTCGTQYPPAERPPDGCPICLDERQYVGHEGQRWTTMAELVRDHRNRVEELEPGLLHEADRDWVMRPSERIEFWSGERRLVSDQLESAATLEGHVP
jgi:hypothetical protein